MFMKMTAVRRSLVQRSMGALALLLSSLSPSASASDMITIGVEETSYLPHYRYADGVYRGFAADLLAKFAKDRDYHLDYRPLPIIRLFAALIDSSIDLKYPDSPLWSAAIKAGKNIHYSDPVVAYVDGVSVLPANVGRSIEVLKTLGTVLGFTAYEWQARIDSKQVALQENRSFEALVRMTQAGRVDGAYGNIAVVAYSLRTEIGAPGGLVFDPSLPHSKSHYQFSSLKRPKLIAEINEWMSANQAWIAQLKRSYQVE